MTVLSMYHVFRCVNELLLNGMECLIIAVTRYVSLCNLNVFNCVKCMCLYWPVFIINLKCIPIAILCIISLGLATGTLQIGIRAKVSTLSLDGPVERSLD